MKQKKRRPRDKQTKEEEKRVKREREAKIKRGTKLNFAKFTKNGSSSNGKEYKIV